MFEQEPIMGLSQPIHGLLQVTYHVYDRERGWLTSKRSIIYGGRHGEPPLIEKPLEEIMEIVTLETRSAIRAMKHRWDLPND